MHTDIRALEKIAPVAHTGGVLKGRRPPAVSRALKRRVSAAPAALCLALGATAAQAQVDVVESAQLISLRAEARAHEHGEGVPRNAQRAVELYCAAAKRGDAEAQYSLGWMYANGRGVRRDDATAAIFFRLAAEQGHQHAVKMQRFVGEAATELPECLREKPPAQVDTAQAPVQAETPQPSLPEFVALTVSQKQALEIVTRLAPQYGVNPRLALAVIRAESNFDATARSVKNAQGLMQLIPETSARFNVAKPFDPVQNVRGGLAYLRWLLAYFQGNVALVAAAYNAGEGTVNRYKGIPPYAETRAYVKRIIEWFGRNDHPYDAEVTGPSPELHRIPAARGF
jgi:TPR repeat protein